VSNSWLVVPRIYLLHLNHSFIHPQHKQFTTSPALLPSSPRNPISCIRLISHNALASPSQHTATPSQHLLRQKTKRRIRKNFVFFFSRKEEEKKKVSPLIANKSSSCQGLMSDGSIPPPPCSAAYFPPSSSEKTWADFTGTCAG